MARNYQRKEGLRPTEWQGILATPVRWPIESVATNHRGEIVESVVQQFSERIEALYKHFNIDPQGAGAADILIMKLAERLDIPGFKAVPAGIPLRDVGHPRKWRGIVGIQLYIDVQRIVAAGKIKKVSKAIESLIDEKQQYKEENCKSLYARYKEVKDRLGEKGVLDGLATLLKHPAFGTLVDSLASAYDGNGEPVLDDPDVVKHFAAMAERTPEF